MARRYRKQKEVTYFDMRVAGGVPLFTTKKMISKMCDALKWCCDKRGLRIYEFVILPDRILLIANCAWGALPDIMAGFKKFTSKAVMLMLRNGRRDLDRSWMIPVLEECSASNGVEGFSIWEGEDRTRSLFTQEMIDNHALKIKEAPVKLGVVKKPKYYLLCSANPANPLEGWQVAVTDRGI